MSESHHLYSPGDGLGIATPRTVILMGADAESSVASRLWSIAQTSEGPDDVVDAVLAIGLRNLPSIGILHIGEYSTYVLVRGAVLAQTEEAVLRAADGALTWVEQAVPIGSLAILSLSEGRDELSLPIRSGVVRASTISVGGAALSEARRLDSSDIAVENQPPTQVNPTKQSVSNLAEVSPAETLETLSATEFVEFDGTVPADVQEMGQGQESEHDLDPDPDAPPAMDDDFEDLFGVTRAPKPVEAAAIRPDADDGEPTGAQATPSASMAALPASQEDQIEAANAPSRLPSAVGGAGATGNRLIDSVPGTAAAAPPSATQERQQSVVPSESERATAFPSAMDEADDVELTVARAQLAARRATPTIQNLRNGPTVHGVFCAGGHPNPASAARCRLCGNTVEPADPITIPRPVLGVLRFSTGMEVELDRPLVVGRSPHAERVSASEIPHLVAVPSPEHDISRDHLEVRIDGWHVLVRDLRSTNGTVVVSPGQAPERLRGGDEVPIIPGTMVTMADEVNFVYEVE